jgi:exodeoxyribonuclease V alpha subunit
VSGPNAEADAIVLEGIVERVTYADETTGFHVVRVRPDAPSSTGATPGGLLDLARARLVAPDGVVTVVGKMPKVGRGEHVRVVGTREQDARHGPQLKASVVTTSPPTSPAGIRRYLASGAIKGVGAKTADRIVDCFGARTLDVLDHAPERLSEVVGLGKAKASQIAAQWRSQRAVRELMLVLASLDIPQALAARIRARYGDDAIDVVRRSPYRLALEVAGVGFKSADAIARKGGIALDDPQRAQAGVLHGVSTMTDDGHTATPRALLAERACALLAPPAPTDAEAAAAADLSDAEREEPDRAIDFAPVVDAAIDALVAGRLLVDTPEGLAHAPLAAEEATLARRLLVLVRAPDRPALGGAEDAIASFEAAVSMQLAPAQRDAVRLVAEHPVVVVTGGPGVGKTTVVRAILALLGKSLRVALTAPTGRAAKRMTEATGREATTIHRLLAIDPRTRRFKHDEATPLEIDALVVDESSMVDVYLAHALVRALPKRARLVLVGDVDQLPSVGPGAFLRDVIESGVVPTARLRDVFRQAASSRIISGAHAILHGRMPEPSERAERGAGGARGAGGKAAGELFIIERKDPEEAARTIADVVEQRLPRAFGFDPKREVQVLVPMIRGVVGTRALNVELQARLNPTGPSFQRSGTIYRVGDRVMQTRNDYDRDVFNGDVGSVAEVRGEDGEGPSVTVRLEDGRMVDYDDEDLDDLVLAYACTVHKAQGSEYPAVVIGLVNQHYMLLARKLLYTAVTRGKQLVVIVASPWALREAVRDARGEERRTRLARLLRG